MKVTNLMSYLFAYREQEKALSLIELCGANQSGEYIGFTELLIMFPIELCKNYFDKIERKTFLIQFARDHLIARGSGAPKQPQIITRFHRGILWLIM